VIKFQISADAWGTLVAGVLSRWPRAEAGLTPLPLPSTSSKHLPDATSSPHPHFPFPLLHRAAEAS